MPSNDNTYTVYRHVNKANGKVYIGITKQDAERRWQNGFGYKGTYFFNAIQKYGWDGFTHEILFTNLSKVGACLLEKRLIKEFRSSNREYGYNICEGGQTGDNLKPMRGAENNKASSVRRIDRQTGETKEYETIQQAADDLGINHRGISKACLGVAKTYMGYVWEYTGKEYQKPTKYPIGKYPHTKQQKKVKLVEPNGEERIFDSLKSAAEYVGVKGSSVSRYINHLRSDSTGRRWSLCL